MPQTFQFKISVKRLLIGLLLTAGPISLLALYASTQLGRQSEQVFGEKLQAVAESAAYRIQDRVRAKVVEAALIASDTAVLAAVRESNRPYGRTPSDQIQQQLEQKDAVWNTPAGQVLAERMLTNPASQSLRRKLTLNPDFLRITVTDRHGATVAASHKTLDFYQADEQYWQDIFVTGRGAVSLTDVLYDEATKSQYIGVGVPVVDENNILIGTLDALVDIASLFPIVNRTDLGLDSRMALVNADGTIIAGTGGVSLSDRAQSIDFGAIEDAAGRFEGRSAGHMKARFSAGEERLVAFADTGLGREHRKLQWQVVASQDAEEALGPSSVSQALIMTIALLTLASIVFFAVYFSLHRQSEIEEMEEMRHPTEEAV